MTQYNDQKTDYLSAVFSPSGRMAMRKDVIGPTIRLPFENMTALAPKAWDVYLKLVYGDYMQLPPEEKRKTHSITAWWKE